MGCAIYYAILELSEQEAIRVVLDEVWEGAQEAEKPR